MERQAKDGTIYKKVGPDQWTPVTRTAKDGTVFKKVGADSWAVLERQTPKGSQRDKVSVTESAARGFAQGGSLGFADEISSATEAIADDLKSLFVGKPNRVNPIFDEHGRVTNSKELTGTYEQRRDESRAAFKKAKEDNPGVYTAGEIGGGLASAAIPLGTTATLGNAIKTSARFGALGGLGQSEAKNLAGVIEDTGAGAGLGALGGTFAFGVGKAISKAKGIPESLKNQNAQKAAAEAAEIKKGDSLVLTADEQSVFKEAAKSAKSRLKSFWNPDIDPSFEEFADIARKNGINPKDLPESVKFGPDSSASRASRSLAEGRFGEETLKRFNKTLDQVRDAFDRKIVNYSKGAPVDEVTAGKILRDSYDEGVNRFFDQMDFTHNTVINQAPGLQLTPKSLEKIESSLNGIEKFAKGRLLRGVTDTQKRQGQQLLNAVDAIRSGNGSYKQTVEALRDIGEAAFQSKNSLADVPVDVAKMRKIYNELNESLIDTVRSSLGDDIADSLIANNKAMSEFFGDKSLVAGIMGDKAIAPEKAFRSLILNGDSQKIQALKKILPPEKWEYLKGAVLENLVKRDAESNFTFRQLHNSMRNKRSALTAIFTPQELVENAGLVRLGDRFGSPVLSSSGTGASLSFQDLYKIPGNVSVDALALKNANRSANKAIGKVAIEKAPRPIRDVSPNAKNIPARLAGSLAGLTENGAESSQTTEEPTRGPTKWANDGLRKLKEHDSKAFSDPALVDKLLKTKKGQDLLIQASDLKPGSKAMDKVMIKIRTSYLNGDE